MNQTKKVQVRFATTSKTIQSINHDFRIAKPNYLRHNMYHNKFDNIYFGYDPKQLKQQAKKSFDEYNQLYKKKHHRNLQKSKQSDHLTGVITLSPIINEWLEQGKVTKEQLEKSFTDSVPLIQDKIHTILGDDSIKLSHYVIHYDEKTPHMHFAFNNHTKNGEAVWYNLRKSGRLSEFQDIVASTFKDIGLERGVRKSTAKHLSVRQMHEEEIKQLKKDIQDHIKQLQSQKKNLKKTVEDKKELKSELDSIDSLVKKARLELKNESLTLESITKEKEELETTINTIKEDKPTIDIKPTKVYNTDKILDECITAKLGFTKVDKNKLKQYLNFYAKHLKKYNEFANAINGQNHPKDLLLENKKLIEENKTLLKQQNNINTYYVTKRRYTKLIGENRSLQEQLQEEQTLTKELNVKVEQSKAYFGINKKLKDEVNDLKIKLHNLDIMQEEHKRMDEAFTQISKYLKCEDDLDVIVSKVAKYTGSEDKGRKINHNKLK
ncbi:plasmid recombination protein [Halarcobacter bivalviorum]|uniref:Recombination/mobilization protein n=1 Tax=Halarcobacter bivalviorum TaxID=663364 RepID=A0AB33GI46_9BACT|nr:plasmid recombination protein [Halarcobacter bivalviorum]AXH11415.1 putative recombination/mobilization protein [Halarcobacter bivalviorum]